MKSSARPRTRSTATRRHRSTRRHAPSSSGALHRPAPPWPWPHRSRSRPGAVLIVRWVVLRWPSLVVHIVVLLVILGTAVPSATTTIIIIAAVSIMVLLVIRLRRRVVILGRWSCELSTWRSVRARRILSLRGRAWRSWAVVGPLLWVSAVV